MILHYTILVFLNKSLENKIRLQSIAIAPFVTFFEISPIVKISISSYHLFNKVPITRTIQTEMSTEKGNEKIGNQSY